MENLSFETERGNPLTPLQQTCLTLTFLASGTFQRTAGYMAGVKKSCASVTVHRVTTAICQMAPFVIKLPTRVEMRRTADYFQARYGLPNFALGVDGTHIRLGVRPNKNEIPNGVQVLIK